MTRDTLIQASHLARQAIIYVRQSTTKQLALHQESTRRQYQLTETAQRLGWPQPRIQVIVTVRPIMSQDRRPNCTRHGRPYSTTQRRPICTTW